ncbi:PEP-CTERM sorting domain-containing protein [Aliiglaciecola litoralis]|uniref:PEP-CTERM protein-sorting domain-containing protein n=1 Tax=Aliiglaciecola litoralis TaxID=582857 RepID=A0ABP3X3T4_9ALTE
MKLITTRLASIIILISTTFVANAGIINNPHNTYSGSGNTPLSVGGTFAADENNLESFTLTMFGDGVDISAFVYGTDGLGTPTGSALWSSDIFSLSANAITYLFNPQININPGSQYLIGARNVNGGQWFIGRSGDNISPGSLWNDQGVGAWQSFLSQDVGSRIVMTTVPEPAPFLLVLVSLGGLLLRRAFKM